MSAKDFKQGMVAGAKPFGDKLDQLADVSESAVSSIQEGLDGVTEVVNVVLDDLSVQERKRIYDLDQATDISSLDDDEKEFLVAVLTELANTIPDVSDYQKRYLRSICGVANIAAPQTSLNLACIENIENTKTQKILLRHVIEFMFIGDQSYAFLDTYEDTVFCYFSVNAHGISEIKSTIGRIFNALGLEGIVDRYTFSTEYQDADSIEEQLEECSSYAEEYIPDPSTYEEIELTDILHVDADDTLVYKYKKIHISAIINVDGTLQFENCIVSFSDKGTTAFCTVKGELSFVGCEIISPVDNNTHSDDVKDALCKGVINGTQTSKITFENCIVHDAGHFVSTAGALVVNSCSINNPGIRFLSIETGKVVEIQNTYFDFDYELCLPAMKGVYAAKEIIFAIPAATASEQGTFTFDNCKFATSNIDSLMGIILINAINTSCIISNSEFYNFAKAGATVFAPSVMKTRFENCQKVVADNIISCYLTGCIGVCIRSNANIDNCDFDDCKSITLAENGTMKNCRIIRCRGRVLESAKSQITDCIFSNIRKWNRGVPTNKIWGKESEGNYPIYLQNSKIISCIFDGVELKDNAFLIVGEKLADSKIPFSVEKCVFRNCYTDRDDKLIIIGREQYGLVVTKTKSLDPLVSCTGLDKVMSGTLEADVPVTDSPNSYGIVAGTAIGAVLAGGLGAVAGSIVGQTVDAIVAETKKQ